MLYFLDLGELSSIWIKALKLWSAQMVDFGYYVSGESMENALRACCKGIKIGKILIHREGDNGQQVLILISSPYQFKFFLIHHLLTHLWFWLNDQLIYEKLPKDISDRHVLLLDPILGTGYIFSITWIVLLYTTCFIFMHLNTWKKLKWPDSAHPLFALLHLFYFQTWQKLCNYSSLVISTFLYNRQFSCSCH